MLSQIICMVKLPSIPTANACGFCRDSMLSQWELQVHCSLARSAKACHPTVVFAQLVGCHAFADHLHGQTTVHSHRECMRFLQRQHAFAVGVAGSLFLGSIRESMPPDSSFCTTCWVPCFRRSFAWSNYRPFPPRMHAVFAETACFRGGSCRFTVPWLDPRKHATRQ